ncbi:MAG: DUF559 domain-containing protein [Actinobacteria bacterium]|nr:DUF559 domain-containing protein [Actinomycetota bacterium]
MGWDQEIRELARAHHGHVDRASALSLGATEETIRWQILMSRWRSVHPGVYDLNVTPPSWEGRLYAAVLAAGADALASHRSALRLWGVELTQTQMVELTVPYDDRPVPEGAIVHRTRRRVEAAEVAGIPVTSVERTLLDVAALLPVTALERTCAAAIRQGITDGDRVARHIGTYGGRGVRGTRKLRSVLAMVADEALGSSAEIRFAQLLRRAAIPQPVPQLQIALGDGRHVYPDFAWPDLRKIVEIDGHDAHSTPERLHDDLVRQNLLLDLGWEMRRFSARRVRRNPEEVLAEVRRFLTNLKQP